MSNVFTLKRRNVEKDEALLNRILVITASLLAAGLICLLFARFLVMPLAAIKRIVVESDLSLTEKEILAQGGFAGGENYFTLSTIRIQQRLEANPLVLKAQVAKIFPDTIRIVLHRREPTALVLADADGRTIPVLIDREGFVFKVGVSSADVDLPVISGLSVGETGLGVKLPEAYRSLFADLAALKEKSPALYGLISEVRVVGMWGGSSTETAAVAPDSRRTSSAVGNRELLLYFLSSPVRIRIAGSFDDNLLKYSLMVMDLLSKQGLLRDIEELDFRGTDVVYGLKEG
jgi:cell division protein FtsQ